MEPGRITTRLALHHTEFRVDDDNAAVFRWPDSMGIFTVLDVYDGRRTGAIKFFEDSLGASTKFSKCHFGLTEFNSIKSTLLELDNCSFHEVRFNSCNVDTAAIHDCYFRSQLSFLKSTIGSSNSSSFHSNRVDGNFILEECTLTADASIFELDCIRFTIERSTFHDRSTISSIAAREVGFFKSCIFGSDVSLQLQANSLLSVPGLTTGDRAHLDLTSLEDEVAIVDGTFGKMSEIRAVGTRTTVGSCDFTQGGSIFLTTPKAEFSRVRSGDPLEIGQRIDDLGQPIGKPPEIHSIRDMDMRHVEFSNIDLSRAVLRGVRNLSDVRINAGVAFADPIYGLATQRRMLANEVEWRRQRFSSPPSYSLARRELVDRPKLREIEQYYRALRKGLEDAGDQPGAADFYYGEMEMRRCRSVGWERLLLQIYWLVSGYGLRAWRSVTTLALVLAAGTFLMWTVGFNPSQSSGFEVTPSASGQIVRPRVFEGERPDFFESALFTLRTSTSLTRPGSLPPLTPVGNIVELAVRILTPALLAITALAIRARVRR